MENVLVWAIDGNLLEKAQFDIMTEKCIPERRNMIEARTGRAQTETILAGYLLSLMKQEYDKKHSWRLEKSMTGKPYWSTTTSEPVLYFSISHTANCAFIAISNNEIGIDVERIAECRMNIAHRFFAKEEWTVLEKKSGVEKDQLFFEMWTRKEAEGKLGGQGLRESLGHPQKETVFTISDIIEVKNQKLSISLCSNQKFKYKMEWIQG